jgi:D-serine deaminase-like pyridoxal phosphate-dependent protein
MTLDDLPTPCLVLDQAILSRNIRRMARIAGRQGVPLRPHMKTAKSVEVARLALEGQPGGITVSTLAEAEYFNAHGITDILYAVAIAPAKLAEIGRLASAGAAMTLVTDDAEVAGLLGGHPAVKRVLIEIDSGEGRSGIAPQDGLLLDVAARLGGRLAGVLSHAGHSYGGRSEAELTRIACLERDAAVTAATHLRDAGYAAPVVSIGSSPTATHADHLAGVTELRAGVFMFGDLFQAEIGTHGIEDIAMTVLTTVIGRRPGRLVIDAGAIALSKDRSTAAVTTDYGYGLVLDNLGRRTFAPATVGHAYQEHGVIARDETGAPDLPVGTRLRIAPNHACLTAAAHDRYFVVDGAEMVVATWTRVNGW